MDSRKAALIILVCAHAAASTAQISEQHSVEGVAAALTTPLSTEAVDRARQFDDDLLASGHDGEQRIYLVTDERARKVNTLAGKLLTAMGENPQAWMVRVLDTPTQIRNAFVVGGRYVYVFTGLLSAAQSDDEIAFVLGHELGHSLLKHQERRQSDFNMQLANLATLIGALAKGKTGEDIALAGQVLGAQYSQQDEAEADALAAAITLRAGFDPLRGADFFTRDIAEREAAAPGAALTEAQLAARRNQVIQVQSACLQWTNAWNSGQLARTQQNADQVNKTCADAEHLRVTFNKMNAEFYTAQAEKSIRELLGSHLQGQTRIAALAATVDFLNGRRDVESLSRYRNAYLVMRALTHTNNVLLNQAAPPLVDAGQPASPTNSTNGALTERLKTLKSAFDAGLITQEEYDHKREALLSQL